MIFTLGCVVGFVVGVVFTIGGILVYVNNC